MKTDFDRPDIGFTLIEILLSISIMAIAAGIIYSSISTGLSAAHRAEDKSELFQRVRIVREIIKNDLANAFTPKQSHVFLEDVDEFEGEQFMDKGKNFDLSVGFPSAFLGVDDGTAVTPLDRIEFYTVSKGTFETDMPVYVSYYIDEDPLSYEKGLVMERIATILPEESFRKELASDVIGLDVRYLDSTPDGQVWVESWEERRKLPRAVEVTLIWNEESRKLSEYTDVPILVSISSTHIF